MKNRIEEYKKININKFLSMKDYYNLFIFSLVSILMVYLPYNSAISYMIQLTIVVLLVALFYKRPVFFLIAYQFFEINIVNIISTRFEREVIITNQEGYYLNYFITASTFVIFIFIDLFVLKRKININKSIFLLSLIILFSVSWAANLSFYTLELVCLLMIYIFAHNFIRRDYELRLIFLSTILNGLIYALISIPYLVAYSESSIYDMLSDTNYTSLYCLSIISICYITLIVYKNVVPFFLKTLIYSVVVLLAFVILLTLSRTGFVVFCLLSVYFIVQSLKSKAKYNLIILVFIFFILSMNSESYVNYFDSLFLRFDSEQINTMNGRTDIAGMYFNKLANSDFFTLMFGNGYYSTFIPHVAPHNTFIAILSFFGIVGMILFIAYLINIYVVVKNSEYKSLELLLLLFLIVGFTLETFKVQILIILLSAAKSVVNWKKMAKVVPIITVVYSVT